MTSAKGGLFWPFMNRINRIHRINRMCSGRSACHERDFLELLRTASLCCEVLCILACSTDFLLVVSHSLETLLLLGRAAVAPWCQRMRAPIWKGARGGAGGQTGQLQDQGRPHSFARPDPPLPALAWWLAAPGPCFALHCTI